LKAFLSYNERPIQKTHDLQLLIEQCNEIDDEFDSCYDDVIILIPYSTDFRYPGFIIEPDISDVNEAIEIAERIYSFVTSKIKS
jgi:HEPN domain-containing protein